MSEIDPTNVSSAYLAEVLGMTRHGVSKLFANGVIKQNGRARGKYNMLEAVPAYMNHMRASKGAETETKLKLQQERKARLANDEAEKQLVKTAEAAEVYGVACSHWHDIASRVPAQVAPKIAKTTNPQKVARILRNALDGIFFEFEKGLNHATEGAIDES